MASRRGTRPRPDQWTEEDARRILGEWAESGMPLYPFARARGLTPQRLAWWRDRLAKRPGPALQLVPARVNAVSGPGGVVVRLAGDVTIELGHVGPAWVAELIRELAGPS